MIRYGIVHWTNRPQPSEDGDYVRYEDAMAVINRFKKCLAKLTHRPIEVRDGCECKWCEAGRLIGSDQP